MTRPDELPPGDLVHYDRPREAEDGWWRLEHQVRPVGHRTRRVRSRLVWIPAATDAGAASPDRYEYTPWTRKNLDTLSPLERVALVAAHGWDPERVTLGEERVEYDRVGGRIAFTGRVWSYELFRKPWKNIRIWEGALEVHGVCFEMGRFREHQPPTYREMFFASLLARSFLEKVTPEQLAAMQQQKVLILEPEAPTPPAAGGRVLHFPILSLVSEGEPPCPPC